MKIPSSIRSVITLLEPYAAMATSPRPKYEPSLPDGLEIEAKIHIESDEDVTSIMGILAAQGLKGFEHRSEDQYMFKLGDGAHICRIEVADIDVTWLKIKSKNIPITTANHKFAAVLRKGVKLKPGDEEYDAYYKKVQELPLMARFNKECINFFYSFRGYVFSLSFSLAWNETFVRREMEFEYEGHTATQQAPMRQEVEEIMEDMLSSIIPQALQTRIHAETKHESLLKLQS